MHNRYNSTSAIIAIPYCCGVIDMYLDYARYTELGGSVSFGAFPSLELRAESLLDEWCSGRLHSYDHNERAEIALFLIVEFLKDESGEQVTSFSNGVNSFSFAPKTRSDLYNHVMEVLPIELISLAVE